MGSALENFELEMARCCIYCLHSVAQGKLNEQLKIVLEENVALQKQLIKLERQYLKSMMKSSPLAQIKGGYKSLWKTDQGALHVLCFCFSHP